MAMRTRGLPLLAMMEEEEQLGSNQLGMQPRMLSKWKGTQMMI